MLGDNEDDKSTAPVVAGGSDGGVAPQKAKKRLELKVGDRVVYITDIGEQIKGTVTKVHEHTKGGRRVTYSYSVKHDYGVDYDAVGQFRWNDKYLFKDGEPIPESILKECSVEDEDEGDGMKEKDEGTEEQPDGEGEADSKRPRISDDDE